MSKKIITLNEVVKRGIHLCWYTIGLKKPLIIYQCQKTLNYIIEHSGKNKNKRGIYDDKIYGIFK